MFLMACSVCLLREKTCFNTVGEVADRFIEGFLTLYSAKDIKMMQ